MQQRFQESEGENRRVSVSLGELSKVSAGAAITPEAIVSIRKSLSDKNPKVKEAAVGLLFEMGKDGVELLLKVMQEENVCRKKRGNKIVTVYVSLIVLFAVISAFSHGNSFGVIGSFSGILGAAFAASQTQKTGAVALAKSEDVRAVPFLVEALSFNEKAVFTEARDGLIRLLPLMRLEHANLLSQENRKVLHKLLKKNPSRREKFPAKVSELRFAILKALEQVGDESSLEVVQEIVDNPQHYTPQLQEAAAECLAYLKTHIGEVQNAQTLLRASDYTEHQDELLRPAYHTDDAPANELLRPESKPGNE